MPQDFRFNPTLSRPLTEVQVEGVSERAACGCRRLSDDEKIAHDNSDCSRMLAAVSDPEHSRLSCLATLLKVPRWFEGAWADDEWTPDGIRKIAGGWHHSHDGKREFVSFAQIEQLIAERIAELGLDRELIEAHGNSCSEPARELWRLPFEVQMSHFRRK